MQRIVDVMQRFGMLKLRFNVSQMIGWDTTDPCGKIIRKPVHFRASVTR